MQQVTTVVFYTNETCIFPHKINALKIKWLIMPSIDCTCQMY